jgi:hypothetical protein
MEKPSAIQIPTLRTKTGWNTPVSALMATPISVFMSIWMRI